MRVALVALTLTIAVVCGATIINVNPGESIQAAITSASPRDTVLMANGYYDQAGIQMKPGVTLTSVGGDTSSVIISATSEFDCVLYIVDCGDTTHLSGFTLSNGFGTNGGGISMSNSSPVIQNVRVYGCMADYGGGICLTNSSPTLTNCLLDENLAFVCGGNLACNDGSDPDIAACTLMHGSTGGNGASMSCDDSSPTITETSVCAGSAAGLGDGIFCTNGAAPTLTNVTFMECQTWNDGQCVYLEDSAAPTFLNCCFTSSGLLTPSLIHGADGTIAPTFTNCNVWGFNSPPLYSGTISNQTGSNYNINADPLYCENTYCHAWVDAASLHLPDNNDSGVLIGRYGEGCDSPVEAASWGAIKAMYR
jgi:hypothetical protein